MATKIGDIGEEVAQLQRRLARAGHQLAVTHIFDDATLAAVMAVQRATGIVVDGIAGPKTLAAIAGVRLTHYLADADLVKAADTLGVPVAAVRAVNEVESRGQGMLAQDGRPVILFERHVFYKQLGKHGLDAASLATTWPAIVCLQPGGYVGGAAEYTRLATAMLVHRAAALEACSWGAFQIMGYHWKALGYDSVDDFVDRMKASEAEQLEAFVRFIANDPALHAALKGRKWAKFAELYNGPAFAANHYDAKLAQAFAKYAEAEKVAA
jgi:hypothetical protein